MNQILRENKPAAIRYNKQLETTMKYLIFTTAPPLWSDKQQLGVLINEIADYDSADDTDNDSKRKGSRRLT
jgi:hypothetical protein